MCDHIVAINIPTPELLQARCPSCRPTHRVKALKGECGLMGGVVLYSCFRCHCWRVLATMLNQFEISTSLDYKPLPRFGYIYLLFCF